MYSVYTIPYTYTITESVLKKVPFVSSSTKVVWNFALNLQRWLDSGNVYQISARDYSFFTDSHSQFLYLIGWWYFCCQKSSHQFHWIIVCMSNKIAELPSSAVNNSLCFQIIISFREVCISHFQINSWQCDLLAISIELSNCFWRTQNIPTPGKVRLLFLKRSFFLGFLCHVWSSQELHILSGKRDK